MLSPPLKKGGHSSIYLTSLLFRLYSIEAKCSKVLRTEVRMNGEKFSRVLSFLSIRSSLVYLILMISLHHLK